MNRFLALDVETANADMSSICQIGIVEFSDGTVVNSWGTLINPEDYFDPFNISIHHITPDMVSGAPRFPDVHAQIRQLTDACVVVTHMAFDQTSLRRAAQKYGLTEIGCTWLDSARVVRRHWGDFRQSGYSLPNICKFLEIQYRSHDAVDDARAAGEVVLRAMGQSGLSVEEWCERAYKRMTNPNQNFSQEGDPDGPFYGETMVFTGALMMPRREAASRAALAGCTVGDGVTKETTILVVGIQDTDKLSGYSKSSKHRKAEKLIEGGQPIKIITEKDFIEMINS
jgi:DNA polymerase-3 subunit epsilon